MSPLESVLCTGQRLLEMYFLFSMSSFTLSIHFFGVTIKHEKCTKELPGTLFIVGIDGLKTDQVSANSQR